MKKHFKDGISPGSQQVEPEVIALIKRMQQQLVFLEKKIDTLIGRSAERPFERKHFSKSSRPFARPHRYGKGKQGNSFRERNFTKVLCTTCKKECEVPFKPSATRPVYCRECLSKRQDGGSFKGKRDNRFDKQPRGEKRMSGKKKKSIFRRRKKRA
jgi:CxxC-x17-CxxC domain-containing protein